MEYIDLDVSDKPKLLIVPDVPDWAFHRIALKIKNLYMDKYDIDIEYIQVGVSAVTDLIHNMYDMAVVLGYNSIKRIVKTAESRGYNIYDKVVFSGYDHLHYEAPARDPEVLFLENEVDWLRNLNYFTVSSQIMYDIYERHFPDKEILIVRDGVNTEEFKPNGGTGRFVVGWCGHTRGNHLKGVDLISRACDKLGLEFYAVDKMEGGLSPDEMPDFYHNIDLYVCASICEGTPNPILEASSCGLPWVSTKVGIVPELYEQSSGGIITQRDPESVTDAIKWMADHETERKLMGRRNRQAILENWTWAHTLSPLGHLFDRILQQK